MNFFITKKTKVLVQGITGHQGSFHTKQMLDYGTHIVAGVTPGKGGQSIEGVPVYDTVKEAMRKHKPEWSVIFVPAEFAKQAAFEALQEGLHVCIISEHVPVHDAIAIIHFAQQKKRIVLGPNCPGFVIPGQAKIGIMPNHLFSPGNVSVVSRSGTLTYEIVYALTQHHLGQRAVIGIGGDPVIGNHFLDILSILEKDKQTKAIILVGEIGGDLEERAAVYISRHIKKPVVAYIAGRNAPPGKTMGHAGAVISGNTGTAATKIAALEKAGIPVAKIPSEIVKLLKKKLNRDK